MQKKLLTAIALYLIIRGFLSLIPSMLWADQAQWIGILEVALGLLAFALNKDKSKQ